MTEEMIKEKGTAVENSESKKVEDLIEKSKSRDSRRRISTRLLRR